MELVRQDVYLTEEEKEELEALEEQHLTEEELLEDSLPSVQAEPEIRQITLFDIAPKTDTYEDTDGSDHDNLLIRTPPSRSSSHLKRATASTIEASYMKSCGSCMMGAPWKSARFPSFRTLPGLKSGSVCAFGNRRQQTAEKQLFRGRNCGDGGGSRSKR